MPNKSLSTANGNARVCDDRGGCCDDEICAEKMVPVGHGPDFALVGTIYIDNGGAALFMPEAMIVSLVGV